MSLSAEQTVASIAAAHPVALRVFHRHAIDFCCGGKRPLAEACGARGLDAAALIAEIAAEEALVAPGAIDWSQRPREELIEYVMRRFHAPLREELLRLEKMANKVLHVHGDKDRARLERLAAVVTGLATTLLPHLQKEESVLFPWLRAGRFADVAAPIRQMEEEHAHAHGLVAEASRLTDGFNPPPGACGTWRALYAGLAMFERDLMEHVHLENNVLFAHANA